MTIHASRTKAAVRRRVGEVLQRDRDDRWAAVFGRIAAYSFVVAVVTGVVLLPVSVPRWPPWPITAPTPSWTAPR